jgi:hypothetical protein
VQVLHVALELRVAPAVPRSAEQPARHAEPVVPHVGQVPRNAEPALRAALGVPRVVPGLRSAEPAQRVALAVLRVEPDVAVL